MTCSGTGVASPPAGASVNRTHNRSNEITDVDQGYSGGDPTFDKNGNTTLVQRGNPNNFGRIFVYDAWNRLVQVDSASPSFTLAKYFYDGLGRKIRDDQNDRDYYYSESWQLLSERNGPTTSDQTLREYVWGLQYVDEILARDEDKNSDGDTRDAADETLFYVQDANWNVQTLCSESGAVAERYRYDPYGTPTVLRRELDRADRGLSLRQLGPLHRTLVEPDHLYLRVPSPGVQPIPGPLPPERPDRDLGRRRERGEWVRVCGGTAGRVDGPIWRGAGRGDLWSRDYLAVRRRCGLLRTEGVRCWPLAT